MNPVEWLSSVDRAGFITLRYLLSVLWQSSLLFGAIFLLCFLLRKRPAGIRHKLWVLALILAPVLPLITTGAGRVGAPQAPVSFLPQYPNALLKVSPGIAVDIRSALPAKSKNGPVEDFLGERVEMSSLSPFLSLSHLLESHPPPPVRWRLRYPCI